MVRKGRVFALTVLFLIIAAVTCRLWPAPPVAGRFPPNFSVAEQREIVSLARRDAVRQALAAMGRGEPRLAWRWLGNAGKQTVRGVGHQPENQIWVQFGIDEIAATDGYAITTRYFMTKTNGHWEVVRQF